MYKEIEIIMLPTTNITKDVILNGEGKLWLIEKSRTKPNKEFEGY